MSVLIVLFAFVLGLVAGGVGMVWLVAPVIGREEAHRALAWWVARRQIEDIQAEALAWMASAVEAAREAGSAGPIISAFENRSTRTDAGEAERPAEPAAGRPR